MSRTSPSNHHTISNHQKHSDMNSLCTAAASGDIEQVRQLIKGGADINKRASDGSLPLCTAAFWGYADIVNLLLDNNANINDCNKTTGWTPTHCAAFQGHGRVLLFLTKYNPDLTIKDTLGRTAIDFASTQEQIWPFFSMLGCDRSTKEKLVELDVIQKVSDQSELSKEVGVAQQRHVSRYSRPGSSYVVAMKSTANNDGDRKMNKPSAAKLYGDVLSEES